MRGNTEIQLYPLTNAGTAKGKVTNTFQALRPGRLVRSMHQAVATPIRMLAPVTDKTRARVLPSSSATRGRISSCKEASQPASRARRYTYSRGSAKSSSNSAAGTSSSKGPCCAREYRGAEDSGKRRDTDVIRQGTKLKNT